jgi:hypothetical protein
MSLSFFLPLLFGAWVLNAGCPSSKDLSAAVNYCEGVRQGSSIIVAGTQFIVKYYLPPDDLHDLFYWEGPDELEGQCHYFLRRHDRGQFDLAGGRFTIVSVDDV